MVKICIAALALLTSCAALSAQSAHKSLRKGDSEYDLEHYKNAEKHYLNATDLKYGDPTAAYNLGNAFYQQGNWDDAAKRFEQAARSAPDATFKADALHNLGNAYLKQNKFKEAVEEYENSLRLRPGDADTKQNLQMAKKKLKEEQQRQQQEQKQKNQEQKQPQDQQNQQNDQKPKQEQQQQGQSQQQPNEGQPQHQRPTKESEQRMKKEEAKRLLETAIGPEDQKNARKYREQRRQPKPSGKEKDW